MSPGWFSLAGGFSPRHAVLRGHGVFLALVLLLCSSASAAQAPARNPGETRQAGESSLIDEARRFMDGYQTDLQRGDRPAIAARYDRNGVYELRPGEKRFTSHADLVARYQKWRRPGFFEWRDLSYEVLAADKVLVTGLFALGDSASASPGLQSYVAVLRRQDGELRIRLEAEAWRDGARWSTLAGVALVSALATLIASWLVRKLIGWPRRRNS